MIDISIKAKNYKCFDDETGFEIIRRVNLIIGKNNVGKSALLDLVDAATQNNYIFEQNFTIANRTNFHFFNRKVAFGHLSYGNNILQNHHLCHFEQVVVETFI